MRRPVSATRGGQPSLGDEGAELQIVFALRRWLFGNAKAMPIVWIILIQALTIKVSRHAASPSCGARRRGRFPPRELFAVGEIFDKMIDRFQFIGSASLMARRKLRGPLLERRKSRSDPELIDQYICMVSLA